MIKSWFSDKLVHNQEKLNSMIFAYQDIGDITNKTVKLKFLGEVTDSTLNWSSHIEFTGKCISSLSLFYNLKESVCDVSLAYFGCIHSYVSYATFAWGHASNASFFFYNSHLPDMSKKI